jgi:DNA-binding response OmpR family regulator
MATPPQILSVGADLTLMSSRSMLLRDAGYDVKEAFSVDKAVDLVASDSIDLVLICHTIRKNDRQVLITNVRKKPRLLPVLCIRSYAYEYAPPTCVAVDNDPDSLLKTVKLATTPPMPS